MLIAFLHLLGHPYSVWKIHIEIKFLCVPPHSGRGIKLKTELYQTSRVFPYLLFPLIGLEWRGYQKGIEFIYKRALSD